MTKEGLIEVIVNKINCSKKDAGEALEAIIEAITKSLAKGEDVTLTGFGTFSAKKELPDKELILKLERKLVFRL